MKTIRSVVCKICNESQRSERELRVSETPSFVDNHLLRGRRGEQSRRWAISIGFLLALVLQSEIEIAYLR